MLLHREELCASDTQGLPSQTTTYLVHTERTNEINKRFFDVIITRAYLREGAIKGDKSDVSITAKLN
jgi:hypothetical protein